MKKQIIPFNICLNFLRHCTSGLGICKKLNAINLSFSLGKSFSFFAKNIYFTPVCLPMFFKRERERGKKTFWPLLIYGNFLLCLFFLSLFCLFLLCQMSYVQLTHVPFVSVNKVLSKFAIF